MLLTLIALILSLFPPKIADGFAVAMAIAYAIVHGEGRTSKNYLNAMLIASVIVFGNLFGVKSTVIAASLILCDAHFLLEVTGLDEKLRKNALSFIVIYTVAGFVYFHAFTHYSTSYILFLSLMGGISASLVEYIRADKSVVVLVASTVYLIFTIYAVPTTLTDLFYAFTLSFALALISTKVGVADESGLLSATLVGTIIIVFTSIRFFLVLLSFYIAGSAATKYMYSQKYEKGIAEPAGGARGYVNVFSNSLPALFFAINYGVYGLTAFKLAFVASVATALGDTMASEIGKTSKKVYLITNLRRVEPGTNGGVSLKGELAAVAGCLIVAAVALVLGIISVQSIPLVFIASFAGVHIDSLLGATLEERGLLTNAGVNFLATLIAGLLCLLAFSNSVIYSGEVTVR